MKNYKITSEITAVPDLNYLIVDNKVIDMSEAKKYLLRYHENLCSKYKLRAIVKSGVVHRYYAWDSIWVEAYNRFILQGLQKRNTEYCTPTPI